MRVKLLLIITLLFNTLNYAQESTDLSSKVDETTLKIVKDGEAIPPEAQTGSSIGITDYLSTIFILIIVIAVLYFVLKFIKKIGGNKIGLDNNQIKILSTKALRGTTALHLVEVGSQVFLIGATDTSVNRISEITDKETIDSIVLDSSSEEAETKTFLQLFTDKLKNIGGQTTEPTEVSGSIKTNKEKLDRF